MIPMRFIIRCFTNKSILPFLHIFIDIIITMKTKIEEEKRLYLLEIDKKESLYVTEDTIVKYMLTKEMILDKDLTREY